MSRLSMVKWWSLKDTEDLESNWGEKDWLPRRKTILLFYFILLLQKALFPFGPRLERGLQDVKKLPSSCREGLQEALMSGRFFKGHWSPETPSRAWGWASWRDTRTTQPGDQPACGGWSGGHPSSWWVSLSHLGSGSPGNHRCGGLRGQKPGHADSASSLREGRLP